MPLPLHLQVWAEFDPDARQFIDATDLPHLVRRVPAPMGIRGAPLNWAVRFCIKLNLAHREGRVGAK